MCRACLGLPGLSHCLERTKTKKPSACAKGSVWKSGCVCLLMAGLPAWGWFTACPLERGRKPLRPVFRTIPE